MSVTVQEWRALEVQLKENLPDNYNGLLDWVLDECTAAAGEDLISKLEPATLEAPHEEAPRTGSVRNESITQDANKEFPPQIKQMTVEAPPAPNLPCNFHDAGNKTGSVKSNSPVAEPQDDHSPATSRSSPPHVKSASSIDISKEKRVQPGAKWTKLEEIIQAPPQTPPLANGTASSWNISAMTDVENTPEIQEASPSQQENSESRIGELPPKTGSQTQPTRRRSLSVAAWVNDTSEAPVSAALAVINTKESSSHCCDIDPMTGELLPAIEQPETRRAHEDVQSEPGWRRGNMTSDMQISREMRIRAKLAELLKQKRASQQKYSPSPVEEQSFFPKADCKIRPAVDSDIAEIADIMNADQRRKADGDSPHPSVVKTWDMQKIFLQCRRDQRPFIVATAIEDPLLDRANWPVAADRAYNAYLKYCSSSSPSKPPSIVGYAFALPRQGASMDTQEGRSDHSCYVTLFVHPDYRSRKYGAALLDRILMSVSTVHRSLIDFDWECNEPAEVYEHPSSNNTRQYSRVFVEYLDGHSEDQRLPSRKQLLEQFGFTQVGHLTCMKSEMRDNKRCWLDLFIWELEAQPLENVRLT